MSLATSSPRFSRNGLGVGLAGVFDSAFVGREPSFLRGERGKQLLIACDIGGSLRIQPYETYAFVVLDLDRNAPWLAGQQRFRRDIMVERRRMAFKAMNDGVRRRALIPFIQLADSLEGLLITFVVEKATRPVLEKDSAVHGELRVLWKPAVADRLLWVIYLAVFLLGGVAHTGQDVLFVIDEDEVAANVPQLTKLTELFARAYANQGGPMLRHFRCGTTKSDDGTLALEDLVALPDLAAGVMGEFTTVLQRDGYGPLSPLLQRLPRGISWKTRLLLPWLLYEGASLDRRVYIIDRASRDDKWRSTIPRWFWKADPLLA